jgi:energy-coupling factor transporter ATP-binding protein EcfA2
MIIIINGPINSGKTTVAKALTRLIPNTAHVEVDSLREFIDSIPLQDAIPICLENAISVTNNLSNRGFNVVITYPLATQEHEYLVGGLNVSNICSFTLSPMVEVALTNRGARELTSWEKKRIKEHYDSEIGNPTFGIVIDNTNQKQEGTAAVIMEYVMPRGHKGSKELKL